jgi:hypothetical protein
MRNRITIFFAFALILLIGSHETTSFFGFLDRQLIERSEEVPSRETEAHELIVSSRVIQPFLVRSVSIKYLSTLHAGFFCKQGSSQSSFVKPSLHILLLALRH